jgi:long-subunit acyl-CoA synthetase (AMP-forming)
VPLNPGFKSNQVIAALGHLDASHLIIGKETNLSRKPPRSNTDLLRQLIPNLEGKRVESLSVPSLKEVIVVDNADGRVNTSSFHSLKRYEDIVEEGGLQPRSVTADLRPDDIINIQFTSGTTSTPKAACLSHASILNNGKSIGDRMLLTEKDIVCCPPPLFQ